MAVWALSMGAGGAAAQTCTPPSPACPVPPDRHGTLVPTTILSDSTFYSGKFEPDCGGNNYAPFFRDIDVEGGVIFGASGNHLEIFDARTNPGVPVFRSRICRPRLPEVVFSKTDTDEYYNYLEAPEGDNTIVAIAGLSNMGAVILKTHDLANPQVIYQHDGYQGTNVATAQVSNVHHAFVTDDVGNIEVYDLARAKALTSPCRGTGCGVYKGRLTGVKSSLQRVRGTGHFLMTLATSAATVWDVSSLSSPRRVGDVSGFSRGADIWVLNGVLYLARGTSSTERLEIYDFPCQSSGTCAARLVDDHPVPGAIVTGGGSVEVSVDASRVYIFAGRANNTGSGPQNEYIFDATDPTNAQELTPQHHPDGYWGWYYYNNPTGFRGVEPTDGVVHGGHLVRAAVSILDVHQIVQNVPPVSNFDLPTGDVYAGQNVTFTDRSSSQPNLWCWGWDFNGDGVFNGTINPPIECSGETSTQQHPSWIVPLADPDPLADPYPHTYPITLQACNDTGCGTQTTKNLTVRDPDPTVASVTVDGGSAPINAVPCQTVQFAGQGIDGRPTLSYSWEILTDGSAGSPASGAATHAFAIPEDGAGKNFAGRLTVTNSAPGSPSQPATSPLVSVSTPPGLAIQSLDYATPVQNGRVTFELESTGATSWKWTFGVPHDLATNTDPTTATFTSKTLGEGPIHQYPPSADAEVYYARVTIRYQCGTTDDTVTQEIPVEVPAFLELEIENFQAALPCTFGLCQAVPNVQITFGYAVDGGPTELKFDWDGNDDTYDTTLSQAEICVPPSGSTSCSGTVNHTYPSNQTTSVTPKMQAVRGTEVKTFVHASQLVFGSGGTGGGGDGGGGDGGGGDTGGGDTGGGGTGGGSSSGSLVARFTYSPTPPKATQAITFNASTSSGSPTVYLWEFGDGSTTTTSNTSVNKTYAQAGTYQVKLEIGKVGTCPLNLCTATTTQTITVQANAPQLSASGDLEADFTVAPEAPKAEAAVTFSATALGSPTSYIWSFGDGKSGGPSSNAAASHTYSAPGVYNVQLEIRKNDAGCVGGVCKATKSKLVTVAPKPRDGTCVDSPTTLCLGNGRFDVSILWQADDGEDAQTGRGQVVEGQTEETGLFWFFDPSNWEVMVKILDGCAVNGYYWVFGASTTDVGFTLIVTDTQTGLVRSYHNQTGVAADAITDTEALEACTP